ncbi:sorting nexin-14 isoform X2 [Cephus cinctus]|nr:sorting nexin-14 isoform X2 [Cephus cinctus]XP_015608101.1 sorting nexin-14 isoform X2 [Cephus cinctus]XP_024946999.1 sorting nexin-14 isoform X2 [Cephus cinctus]XP_024947000.1 sorting nexin-14 isoform X2 [Cephus cinctus]
MKESCGVCGGNGCKRHRPSQYNTRIKVPKDFDDALEELLEQLLQTYVCTWYSDLSSDETFLQQLKITIATAARNIAGRLFSVNLAGIIFNNLIPVALHHAQDWKALIKRSKSQGGSPQDYVGDYLGSKVHPAAYSREEELNYLRGLVTALMPHLLPTTHISTNNRVILREILANWVLLPAMDALADPDNINTLIVLSTHHEGTLSETIDSISVPLLYSWVTPPMIMQTEIDPLKPSLEDILHNPQLLYLFMQHIKEAGPVNLLQFCLDIDDLSKRMLNPEMSPETEENLFIDAQNLYSTYLNPEGPDYLHLPLHISMGMRQILESGPSKIQELRTSRPLYQAHQEAHALLEVTCLPLFHHSYELYKLVCGQQTSSIPTRASGQMSGAGVGARLSNQFSKIRGVLRASAVDGAPYQSQQVYQAEEVDCSPRAYNEDNSNITEYGRDLTTWRVTVPHVDGGGAQPLYMVAVHSVAEDKSWTVLRRDVDFYDLRARLTEFHGDRELNDSPLPTRKTQHPSLNTNRQRYQDFLQKLLAKPTLRSSELLHIFLTAPNLKPYFTNYSTPDIGVLYQSMAHKLRKEKGQHLDKFMSTFLASINLKNEHADLGVEPTSEKNYNETVKKGRDLLGSGPFGNNLNLNPRIKDFPYVASKRQHVKGASFCIAEALESLLDTSHSVCRVSWLVASLSRNNLDPVVNRLLENTLVKLLSGGRAAIVVKLLHSNICGTKSNKKDVMVHIKNKDKYKNAKEGLYSLLPWWFVGLHSTWFKLMDSLLEPLQNAPLNKHLAYMLLDQLLANLFPELTT